MHLKCRKFGTNIKIILGLVMNILRQMLNFAGNDRSHVVISTYAANAKLNLHAHAQ